MVKEVLTKLMTMFRQRKPEHGENPNALSLEIPPELVEIVMNGNDKDV